MYRSICSNTSFFALRYFSLFKFKVFSNRLCIRLSFFPCKCRSFQTDCHCFHTSIIFPAVSILPLSKRSDLLLIHFFVSLLYLKSLISFNNQFSIDSFIDLERSSLGFSLVTLFSLSLAISVFDSTPRDAPYSLHVQNLLV